MQVEGPELVIHPVHVLLCDDAVLHNLGECLVRGYLELCGVHIGMGGLGEGVGQGQAFRHGCKGRRFGAGCVLEVAHEVVYPFVVQHQPSVAHTV